MVVEDDEFCGAVFMRPALQRIMSLDDEAFEAKIQQLINEVNEKQVFITTLVQWRESLNVSEELIDEKEET